MAADGRVTGRTARSINIALFIGQSKSKLQANRFVLTTFILLVVGSTTGPAMLMATVFQISKWRTILTLLGSKTERHMPLQHCWHRKKETRRQKRNASKEKSRASMPKHLLRTNEERIHATKPLGEFLTAKTSNRWSKSSRPHIYLFMFEKTANIRNAAITFI